jgi:hypothetical protein
VKGALVVLPAAIVLLAALDAPRPPIEHQKAWPALESDDERRRRIDELRARVAREAGGVFGPVNRSREEARRVRQAKRNAERRR